MRVDFELTAAGKAAKLFYHVPRVDLSVSASAAGRPSYLVILESLAAPLLISHLPTDLKSSAGLSPDHRHRTKGWRSSRFPDLAFPTTRRCAKWNSSPCDSGPRGERFPVRAPL